MADKLDEFKKSFDAVSKSADKIAEELGKHERLMGQTSGIITEGCKEIGLRISELKESGTQGTTLKDFLSDKDVKTMHESIQDHLQTIDTDLTRVTALKNDAIQKLTTEYSSLKKDLTAEVAKRKKEVSSKLGIGNKSLPDMEKLLKTVKDYEGQKPYTVIEFFNPESISDHEKQVQNDIAREIGKSKGEVLNAQQKLLQEQALNVRVLAGRLGKIQILYKEVLDACKDAQTAVEQGDNKALTTAKAGLAKPMKELSELAEPYKTALSDTWLKSQLALSKDKAKIEDGIHKILAMQSKAREELGKVVTAHIA